MRATALAIVIIVLLGTMACRHVECPEETGLEGVLSTFLHTEFQPLHSFDDLPESIQEYLGRRTERFTGEYSGLGGIADPGQPFNRTDDIEQHVPFRRMVLAGVGAGLTYICYEHGGFGYHHHLAIFREGEADLLFASRFNAPIRTRWPLPWRAEPFSSPAVRDVQELKRIVQCGAVANETEEIESAEYW